MPVNASVVVTTLSKIQIIKSLRRAVVVTTLNKRTVNAHQERSYKETQSRALQQIWISGVQWMPGKHPSRQRPNQNKHEEAIERDFLDGQAQQPTPPGMRVSGCGYTPPISKELKQARS